MPPNAIETQVILTARNDRTMQYFLVFSLFVGIATSSSSGTSWGYGQTKGEVYGPADWYIAYPICAGQAQSPINIDTHSVQPKCFDFADELDIDFHNDDGLVVGTLSNNGHAPTLNIDKSRGTAILTGGPANGVFVLEQLHFHFGCDYTEGSEHTIDQVAYPAEVHFVFYNHKYGSLSVAAEKSDGLVVVGVFFKMSALGNKVLRRLARKLNLIVDEGSAVVIGEDDKIFLEGFLPDIDDTQYYTYKGSLTTPACYQSVQWIVLKEKLPIGILQLRVFRKLKATHGHKHGMMCDNFRPTQPLNGRTVYHPKNS